MTDISQGMVDAALKSVRDLHSEENRPAQVERSIPVPDPVDQAYGIMREEMEEGQRRAFKRILDMRTDDGLRNRIQAILNDGGK